MQRAADSSRGSSTSALLVDTLKSNFAEQVGLYERKIKELNRVCLCINQRVEQQQEIIKSLLEDKKRDRLDIVSLEKKVAGLELENAKLGHNITLQLASEMREKSTVQNTHRNLKTEESEMVPERFLLRLQEAPGVKSSLPSAGMFGFDEEELEEARLDTINDSLIKDNPFEVEDQSHAKDILIIEACGALNKVPLRIQRSKDNTVESLQRNDASPQVEVSEAQLIAPVSPPTAQSGKKQGNSQLTIPPQKTLRLVEEIIIIGLPKDIKNNLRTIPTINPVEYCPTLIHSYPPSERS